ncbi:MAG: hypothetical protein KGJ02_01575 [Verrucomicrobiota bacterium]|nr:hypothetical protein [Verrucomicrobiota bacterium]
MKQIVFFLALLPFVIFGVTPPHYHRTPSPPYISGDGFRDFADFAYDELDMSLNPAQVQEGNTIFVKNEMLKAFFESVHPHIEHPYILITHNSDDPAPGPFASYLDDPKLIAWFGHNGDAKHPKFTLLPMGIANKEWPFGNIDALKKVIDAKDSYPKTHLLFMNFTIQNNYHERFPLFRMFGYVPYCYRTGKRLFNLYLTDLIASKFVLSPRGIALDTHRAWESVYIGTYPIVRSSSIDGIYEDLPFLVVKKWEEVNEEFLKQKYEEMQKKTYKMEKLNLDYWINKIKAAKEAYFKAKQEAEEARQKEELRKQEEAKKLAEAKRLQEEKKAAEAKKAEEAKRAASEAEKAKKAAAEAEKAKKTAAEKPKSAT